MSDADRLAKCRALLRDIAYELHPDRFLIYAKWIEDMHTRVEETLKETDDDPRGTGIRF